MAQLPPWVYQRFIDSTGVPVASGKVYTYAAGTTTEKATYTDASEASSHTNPVILDAGGYPKDGAIWLGDGAYKFVVKDQNDTTIDTIDDIAGSSISSFGDSVTTISANTSITSAYENALILTDTSPTLSLLSAATAKEGFTFAVKNTDAGTVTIEPDGADTIDGNANLQLTGSGTYAQLFSDGTNWVSTSFNVLLDEDDMASDSDTQAPTQQSVKAYVDSKELPVGSIYMNDADSTNPATLLGYGTWVAIQDRMIIGASGTYVAQSTGGSATTTQTTSTMASHHHEYGADFDSNDTLGGAQSNINNITKANWTKTENTNDTGSGNAMTTISPYYAAYIWRRTA